jgi:hypothetical protein
LHIALPFWLTPAIFVGLSLIGLALGGREERVTAAALLLGFAATLVLRDRSWHGTQWAGFAIDVAFLVLIVIIALRTRRYWPLAAAGFQLLGVMTHAARMIDPHVGAWAYITAGVIWSHALAASVAIGAINVWRERRQPAASGVASAAPGATRR